MYALKVLRRDKYLRRIDIECPHCHKPVPLSPSHVTLLEDGTEILGWCPECRRGFSVDLPAIGGYVWSPS
jgi:hypothetical protein